MECIKVFEKDSREYDLLSRLANVLSQKSPRRYRYFVGETYFDYGQGWMWTTVLCSTGSGDCLDSYQALCPRDQRRVLECDGSPEAVAEVADAVLADKFCPDRPKGEAR